MPVDVQLFQHHLFRRSFIIHPTAFVPLLRICWVYLRDPIWALSLSSIGLFIYSLLLGRYYLYHSSFCRWVLKLACQFSQLFFSFSTNRAIVGALFLQIDFRIILLIYTESNLLGFWFRWQYRSSWKELTLLTPFCPWARTISSFVYFFDFVSQHVVIFLI